MQQFFVFVKGVATVIEHQQLRFFDTPRSEDAGILSLTGVGYTPGVYSPRAIA